MGRRGVLWEGLRGVETVVGVGVKGVGVRGVAEVSDAPVAAAATRDVGVDGTTAGASATGGRAVASGAAVSPPAEEAVGGASEGTDVSCSAAGTLSGAVKKSSAVISSRRSSFFCRLANTSSVLASACSTAGLGADAAGTTAGVRTAAGNSGLGLWRAAGFSSFAGTAFTVVGFAGDGVKDWDMGSGWMR